MPRLTRGTVDGLLVAAWRLGVNVSVSVSFTAVRHQPAEFTPGIVPGHGRRRTEVNTGQQCWKACWGQPSRVRISLLRHAELG